MTNRLRKQKTFRNMYWEAPCAIPIYPLCWLKKIINFFFVCFDALLEEKEGAYECVLLEEHICKKEV